jgi:hypothetical protein
MNQKEQPQDTRQQRVPQIQVRVDLNAGASVEACMENLAYWQKQYQAKCGGPLPTPYYQ